MELIAEVKYTVYVTATVRVIDKDWTADEFAGGPLASDYPLIYAGAATRALPATLAMEGEANSAAVMNWDRSARVPEDVVDIAQAIAKMRTTKDDLGNEVIRTFGAMTNALEQMGVTFVDSLDKEVARHAE